MKRFKNILTFEPVQGKVITDKSLTVPDQTMSIRTILQRYARGLPIAGTTHEPEYLGEDMLGIDLRTLDISERAEVIGNAKRELQEIQDKIEKEKAEKAEKAIKEKYFTEFKELHKNDKPPIVEPE